MTNGDMTVGGDATVTGLVTAETGIRVPTGGVLVEGGGSTIVGGVTVSTDGLSVVRGGAVVEQGGATVTGGVTVVSGDDETGGASRGRLRAVVEHRVAVEVNAHARRLLRAREQAVDAGEILGRVHAQQLLLGHVRLERVLDLQCGPKV